MGRRNDHPDSAPSPKRARIDEAPVSFQVSDTQGDVRTFLLSRVTCREIPFLDRKISTAIGDEDSDDRRRIALPTGCSVDAFGSLVRRVERFGFVQARLCAPDMGAAITLLRTADFLLLQDFAPEIVALCKGHISSIEDVNLLKTVPIAKIDELSQELTGGQLVASMDAAAAKKLAEALCTDTKDVYNVQFKVLYDWMCVGGRTKEEITPVFSQLSREVLFFHSCTPSRITLKNGARSWIRAFANLAAERPAYSHLFHYLAKPILLTYPDSVQESDMKDFLSDLLVPFRERPMTMNEIQEFIPVVLKSPQRFRYNVIAPFLELLHERSFSTDELKIVLPPLCATGTDWAAAEVVCILKTCQASGYDYGVKMLSQCPSWHEAMTATFLGMLASKPKIRVIGWLLPKLHKADIPADVKKYVEDAVMSGKV